MRASRCVPFLLAASFAMPLLAQVPAPAPQATPAPQITITIAGQEKLLAVVWMQRAAEYRAACLQAYRTAAAALPEAIDDPAWTACLEQGPADTFRNLPPAVVLDVDETILDNSAYGARLIADHATYESATWSAWVHEQQAGAIPGALAYVQKAQQLGARVFYVTNRKCDREENGKRFTDETDTRANLRKLGFPIVEGEGEDAVLCAGEVGDKAARRAKLCERFRIVQLVGDNLGDFAPGTDSRKEADTPHGKVVEGAHVERVRSTLVDVVGEWWGVRWILIPNPSYGGFEDALRAQNPDLNAALRLQR